jgi:hypothetical protein
MQAVKYAALGLCWVMMCCLGTSCQRKKPSRSLATMTWEQRMAYSKKMMRLGAMQDEEAAKPYRSRYDPSRQKKQAEFSQAGGLARKKFHQSQFKTQEAYTKNGVKTPDYSGGDDKSAWANDGFAQADAKSPASNDTFRTDDSRFAGQKAQADGQRFRDDEKRYETPADLTARKSQEKNRQPQIVELEEAFGPNKGTAYSEKEVKSLLGRD